MAEHISPNKNAETFEKRTATLNNAMDGNYFANPILNKNIGTYEPPTEYLRAGLQAYADGVNWDPGSGEGIYYYNAAGAWVKL